MGANLHEAILGEWAQGEAIAEAAQLRGADLRLAYLNQVDLADARLDGADFRSVFLRAGEGPHRRRAGGRPI